MRPNCTIGRIKFLLILSLLIFLLNYIFFIVDIVATFLLFRNALPQNSLFSVLLDDKVRYYFRAQIFTTSRGTQDFKVISWELTPFRGLDKRFVNCIKNIFSHLLDILWFVVLINDFRLARSHSVVVALYLINEIINVFDVQEGSDPSSIEQGTLEWRKKILAILTCVIFYVNVFALLPLQLILNVHGHLPIPKHAI